MNQLHPMRGNQMSLNTMFGDDVSFISLIAGLCLFASLGAGCSSVDDDDQDRQDTGTMQDDCEKKPPSMPAAHACWHVCVETPIEVDATDDSDSSVPNVQFGKTYSVSLNDQGDGTYSGTVRFNAAEDGREAVADGESKEIHFHTVEDVPMNASPTNASDTLSVADSNEYRCDQGLKYSKVFEMGAESYDVTIGPTESEQATLVVVPLNGPAFK